MLFRFFLLIVAILTIVNAGEPEHGAPPPNGTDMGNDTMLEARAGGPPMDGMNGTVVQENGNKTGKYKVLFYIPFFFYQ